MDTTKVYETGLKLPVSFAKVIATKFVAIVYVESVFFGYKSLWYFFAVIGKGFKRFLTGVRFKSLNVLASGQGEQKPCGKA